MISKLLVKSPAHHESATSGAHEQPLAARPSRRRWPWLLVLIAVAVGAYFAVPRERIVALFHLGGGGAPSAPPARVIPVVAASARQGNMELNLNGLGSVTALYTVTLRSRVEGELLRVHFTEGQLVKQGDLLAEIDPRPYEVQKRQAEGQLLKDKAALSIAQLNLERYTLLAPAKTITKQQLDEQEAIVRQCEAAVETDQAQVNVADLQLQYCQIKAPISGTIGLRMVDPGNMVKANDPTGLAVINQLQPITVVFTIPQDDIARIQKQINTGRKLMVDAYDRDFKTKLATGSLTALDNQVDTLTGTVRLKAVFPNDDNLLFPNQFVNARLQIETLENAIIVPSPAVQQGPNSTFVYVVRDDSTVEVRNVKVGPIEGDETAIESGLAAGEQVVVDGVDKLQPGTKVVMRQRTTAGGSVAAKQPDERRPSQAAQ